MIILVIHSHCNHRPQHVSPFNACILVAEGYKHALKNIWPAHKPQPPVNKEKHYNSRLSFIKANYFLSNKWEGRKLCLLNMTNLKKGQSKFLVLRHYRLQLAVKNFYSSFRYWCNNGVLLYYQSGSLFRALKMVCSLDEKLGALESSLYFSRGINFTPRNKVRCS